MRVLSAPEAALDAIWERGKRELGILGRRDAQLIGWRFLDNPVCTQEVVLIEGPAGPVGWAALEYAPHGCLLVDFLWPTDPALGGPLGHPRHEAPEKQGAPVYGHPSLLRAKVRNEVSNIGPGAGGEVENPHDTVTTESRTHDAGESG